MLLRKQEVAYYLSARRRTVIKRTEQEKNDDYNSNNHAIAATTAETASHFEPLLSGHLTYDMWKLASRSLFDTAECKEALVKSQQLLLEKSCGKNKNHRLITSIKNQMIRLSKKSILLLLSSKYFMSYYRL